MYACMYVDMVFHIYIYVYIYIYMYICMHIGDGSVFEIQLSGELLGERPGKSAVHRPVGK